MADMTAVMAKTEELNNDLSKVQLELKRVASVKCRLKKMPGRKTYQEEMTKVLQEEQLLKSVRDYLTIPKKNVNTITQEDIDIMTYDEVCKAIKAVQSKKTHTKWAEDCEKDAEGNFLPGTGKSYFEACALEDRLQARRNAIKPADDTTIRKSDLRNLIEELKGCKDITAAACIERIERLV